MEMRMAKMNILHHLTDMEFMSSRWLNFRYSVRRPIIGEVSTWRTHWISIRGEVRPGVWR